MTENTKTQTVKLLSTSGSQLGELSLDGKVFGVEPNIHVMHLALKRQLNNARRGTACAKTRAEVSGGGKKPWKQKGTGRARAGSIRSPLFAGGGVVFGPKPRSYETNMPQKARKLALKSALSAKLEAMIVVKDFSELKEAKTKAMAKILKDLGAQGKILIIADLKAEENKAFEQEFNSFNKKQKKLLENLTNKELSFNHLKFEDLIKIHKKNKSPKPTNMEKVYNITSWAVKILWAVLCFGIVGFVIISPSTGGVLSKLVQIAFWTLTIATNIFTSIQHGVKSIVEYRQSYISELDILCSEFFEWANIKVE